VSQATQRGTNKGPARDVILGHGAECDGIEEYDNALPNWWLGLFYFTLAFGVVYTIHYHFVAHRSQASAYTAEITAANLRWPPPKAVGVDLSAQAVEEGKAVFMSTCVACHGVDLHGGIGPDLLDSTWIHGGSPEEILRTITEGVGNKGMPAWGPVLGPVKVARAAAFVYDSAQKAQAANPAPATEATPATEEAPATEATPATEEAPAGTKTGSEG